jgi:hypothetical protein
MRWLTSLALKYKLYYRWSKVYQWLYERKYRNVELPTFYSLEDIQKLTDEMQWRKDTWVMLWDAISTPRATYGRHVDDDKDKAGDCDDISLSAISFIENMVDNGYINNIREVGLLSCPWLNEENKAGGHNVGVFAYKEEIASAPGICVTTASKFAHISNWHSGRIQYGFDSLEDVVKDVLSGPGRNRIRTSLGWAFATTGLKLVKFGNGKDL